MTAQDWFTELPDDTPGSIMQRARSDFDSGYLSGAGVLDAAEKVLAIVGGSDVGDRLEAATDLLEEERALHAVTTWQLKVAIAALAELREKSGCLSNEVSYCLGRLTSVIKPPTASEVSEYDTQCAEALDELNAVGENSCLRPGRDEDFRHVAERLDLLDEMPD